MTTAEILAALVAAAPPGTDPLNAECGTDVTIGVSSYPVIEVGQWGRDGSVTIGEDGDALVWNCGEGRPIPGDWSDAFAHLVEEANR